MAASFTIPTYFTAIDKFSTPIQKMSANMDAFASKAEVGLAKSERAFRKMTPALGEASRQMLSMVGTAAMVSAAVGGIVFSGKAIMSYEDAIASLSAITGTTGKTLDVFKSKIKEVAIITKSSSIEVANAFTQIGNNNPALLKDANALAEVTKQSIILAKAAKMELAPAADYLTSIMNQFNTPANQAKKVIDLLAGGMVIGSTDINAVSDAIVRFGGVASQVSGLKLPEAVTMIETISDKMKDPEKVGTQFRNMFLIMSNIRGQDPKALKDLKQTGVNMAIIASKTTPLIDKLKELQKLASRPGALEHVFGKENMQSIIPLLAATDKYEKQLKQLTQSEEAHNAAQKMADKNYATLSKMIETLKNKFVTWITTSDEAARALEMVKMGLIFLANNITTIIKVLGVAIGFFTAWWMAMKLVSIYLILTKSIAATLFLVDMLKYIAATRGITIAMAAWEVVLASVNALMLANPIGLVIVAIAAIAAAIYSVIKYWDTWGASITAVLGILGIFFSPIIAGFALIISIIQSFRRNWDMITKAFSSGGILSGIMAIGKALFDVVLYPIQQIMGIVAKLTNWEWAKNAESGLKNFRKDIGLNVEGEAAPANTLNPKAAQAQAISASVSGSVKNSLVVDFKNMPTGVTAYQQGNSESAIPFSSSTMTH